MKPRNLILICVAFPLGACATSSGEGTAPQDMSAEQHRQQATQLDKSAAVHERRLSGEGEGSGPSILGSTVNAPDLIERHQEIAGENRAHANAHRRAAEALERFEDAQCKETPSEVRALCPLLGAIESATDTERGVRLKLRPEQHGEGVASHVRCHFAYGQTRGFEGMETCPLYLEGLRVSVVDDHTIDLIAPDSEGLEALRERVRAHLRLSGEGSEP